MGWSLKEADFIPSEEWLGEYMGEQGLRYRMDKTPQEVEEEGEQFFAKKGRVNTRKKRLMSLRLSAGVSVVVSNSIPSPLHARLYGYMRAKQRLGACSRCTVVLKVVDFTLRSQRSISK